MVEVYAGQSMLFDYFEEPHLVILDSLHAGELKEYLERQGFRVSLARDQEEVLLLVYEAHPDLVILDLEITAIDCIALCQRLKADRSLGYLPIIMMTNTPEEHEWLAGRLAGADEYLAKPIIPKELLLRVQALMWVKRQIDKLVAQNRTLAGDLAESLEELSAAREIAIQVEMIQRHLTHNVNHEFRTPLLQIKSSIAMLTTLLKKEVPNPQAHTLAEMATQATARLESIVQNLIPFEILEKSKAEPMILHHAITMAIKHFQRSWAHQDDLERIEQFLGAEPPAVLGDPKSVSRVLINLIDNALKFSPPDKKVEIIIRTVDDKAWVAVKDYGIGIAEKDWERIFEPFVQLDAGSTREYPGIGIGLTIAQNLAKKMGTRIQVKSKPGDGALFSFTLPIVHLDSLDK